MTTPDNLTVDDPSLFEVDDVKAAAVEVSVIGNRIVGFHRKPTVPAGSDQEQNTVTITLEDGSALMFVGWGYDACGVETYYRPGR